MAVKKKKEITNPTVAKVRAARRRYDDESGWDLSYRGVREGIERALKGQSAFTLGEEIIRFLLDWNRRYYNIRGLRKEHIKALDASIEQHRNALMDFRERQIESLNPQDEEEITVLFSEFKAALGQTGAAKALHVLAPKFFPPWDTKIRDRYGVGAEANDYLDFLRIRQGQCAALAGGGFDDPIKALDEWDWVKDWLPDKPAA
jgi:hypothetical protein